MKALIVEDDLTSRLLLQKILGEHGEIDVALDGREAVDTWQAALESGAPFDLICLDIMLPKMDGHAVLREIRGAEREKGILGLQGVKIIMTTALGDPKNLMKAFRAQCEAYLVKPIDKASILRHLRELGLTNGKRA